LSFNPLLAFVMLAMGTTAVSAGMGYLDGCFARLTFEQHLITPLTAASPHGCQGLLMAWQQLVTMEPLEFALIALD
jgi:hypothetical protein